MVDGDPPGGIQIGVQGQTSKQFKKVLAARMAEALSPNLVPID